MLAWATPTQSAAGLVCSTNRQTIAAVTDRLLSIATAAALIACLVGPVATLAENSPFLPVGRPDIGWPFLRGPDYNGRSAEIGLADEWPVEGPPVLWHRELGQGYSAFVARGDQVYTQAQSLGGQYVYCLDADTGATKWRHRYAGPHELIGVYPGPRATPTLSGECVYFAAPDGLIGCLHAGTGQRVWSRNVVRDFGGSGGVGFGYSCSPTVIDGLVILPVGGVGASLVALDARSGETVWSEGDDPSSYTPAYPFTLEGRKLVCGYLKNALVVHDRLTGERLLRKSLSHGYDEHAAWPIYSEPYLWLSGPFHGGSRLLKLTFDDRMGVDTVWTSQTLSNDVVSSVMVEGHVFGFDILDVQAKVHRPSRGKFRCIEFLTGNTKWSHGSGRPRRRSRATQDNEIGQAGLIAADGKLILLSETGELILLRATPEHCEELARASVLSGELTWTPPALHRGRVYLRNQSRAVCVYLGEPDLRTGEDPAIRISEVPQSAYRDLAGTILAIEPEYAFDIPTPTWLGRWWLASLTILIAADSMGWLVVRRNASTKRRQITRTVAFFAGAAGTTFLSGWLGQFYFTWPICLYVAFEAAATKQKVKSDSAAKGHAPIKARLPLLLWVIICVVYFLLCRRLSLVFEWAFLAGFVGALPFCRLDWDGPTELKAGILRLLSFTAFYAVGAGLLMWKY